MSSLLSNADFWRAFIAIWLQIILFQLILRERARLEFEPYQLKIEADIKELIATQEMQNTIKQIEEQQAKLERLNKLMEEIK